MAQKNLDLDAHLKKFEQFHQKQIQKSQMDSQREFQNTLLKNKKFRDGRLDNIKKSEEFRNNWEQSNQ